VDHSLLKTTILLLVSDSVLLSVLAETLEREGYTVLATGDLGQAVPVEILLAGSVDNPYLCSEFAGARCSYVSSNEMPKNEGSTSRRSS
jgi:hypothetical protein